MIKHTAPVLGALRRARRRPRVLVAGAAALSLLALAACGSSSTPASGSGNTKLSADLLWFPPNNFADTFACDAFKSAKQVGMTLKNVSEPETDYTVTGEASILQALAATKPKAIITSPADTTAQDSLFTQLEHEGIKIIFFDDDITNNKIVQSQIYTNYTELGKTAADLLGAKLHGKGTVLAIAYNPGIAAAADRLAGFSAEMKAKYPDIKILPYQYDQGDHATDASIVEATLARYPHLAGIFGTYDEATDGVLAGLRSANDLGKVTIVSSDADPYLVTALKAGYIYALLPQQIPAFAKLTIDSAAKVEEGKSVPETQLIAPFVITAANVNTKAAEATFYASKVCN